MFSTINDWLKKCCTQKGIDMKDTNGLGMKKVGLFQTCMLQFHLHKYLIYAYKHEGFF